MGSDRKKNRRKKDTTKKQYTALEGHRRQEKALIPPLADLPKLQLTNWVRDRLPDLLWCALLISETGRESALATFREVAKGALSLDERSKSLDLGLTELARLPLEARSAILSSVLSNSENKTALRPLLLLEDLPARDHWITGVGAKPIPTDWDRLKVAVMAVLDHQSQEATDCRWARVLFMMTTGRLHLPSEELVKKILHYPEYGDMRAVRPLIRSSEGAISQMMETSDAWSRAFWQQCLRDTQCEDAYSLRGRASNEVGTTRDRVREIRQALAKHYTANLETTEVDARHDASFGIAGLALGVLEELLLLGNSTSVLGQMGLRSLLEYFVTLAFLAKHDDPSKWLAFRNHGAGQAKLAFLKLDDSADRLPSYVNIEFLQQLANEDMWQEFRTIGLGQWAQTDLRRMSEEVGVKDQYDRYYPWTSAFVHGNWAAVRGAVYGICSNPLHRLHRSLLDTTTGLGDVVPDACLLVDKIVAIVDQLYPSFPNRVTINVVDHRTGIAEATPVHSLVSQQVVDANMKT